MNRIIYFILFILTVTTIATPLLGKGMGEVQVIIDPVFNGKPLVLDSVQYTDGHGDTLFISLLRFYISNISFENNTGLKSEEKDSYHLVSTEDSGSNVFRIKDINTGSYTSMRFILGVDSMANVSGAMGGDLDPTKGMYWAWNTGYIMAKLEGRSNVCKTLHHAFEFHIGGYIPPYSAARPVTLSFRNLAVVKEGAVTTIHIQADVSAWFRGGNIIDLAKTNSVLMPCANAMMLADNYKNMFVLSELINP